MLRIHALSQTPEKLFSRLVLSGLDFYSPEKREGELVFEISVFSFFAWRRVAEALDVNWTARPLGLFGVIWRNRRRHGMTAGIIIGIFLIYLSTFYVWSVKIEGEGNIPRDEILNTLAVHGFYEGVNKKTVDTNEIELLFLADRSEFSFCSININGGVAHVELSLREPIRFPEDPQDPYNLVADTDGVIVRAEATDGTLMVKSGDTVHKGQLLVSGVMENTTNTAFRLRRAEGRVWARSEHVIDISVPLRYVEKRYIKEKEAVCLRVLGRRIGFAGVPSEGDYDIISTLEEAELFGKELPFKNEKILYAFYTEKAVNLTENTALVKAHDLYRRQKSIEFENAVVEKESFSHEIKDGNLILTCRVTAVEDIAVRRKIEVK